MQAVTTEHAFLGRFVVLLAGKWSLTRVQFCRFDNYKNIYLDSVTAFNCLSLHLAAHLAQLFTLVAVDITANL
jgi:hypothetical protein